MVSKTPELPWLATVRTVRVENETKVR